MMARWTLIVAQVAVILSYPTVTAVAQPAQSPRTAIVLDFANKAGSRYDSLARTATDTVAVELADSGRFDVLKRSEVDRQTKELGLKPPLDQIARSKLAAPLGAQVIVQGSLEFIRETKKKKHPGSVEVGLKVWMEDA